MLGKSEFTERELLEQFDRLPLGGTIQVPASLIRPVEGDDGKKSRTLGEPIEVFHYRRATPQGQSLEELRIEQGHHRFFRGLDSVRLTAKGPVDNSQILFTVRKVQPSKRHY